MLEITSKRPTLVVRIDGEVKHVPLTFNRAEMEEIGKSDSVGDATAAFFARYLGDAVEEMGDDQHVALIQAWETARGELGEPSSTTL